MTADGISQPEIGNNSSFEAPSPSQPTGIEAYKAPPFIMESFKATITYLGIGSSGEIINKSATSANLLGSGGNASVFKIPGLEGFVLRIPNGRFGSDTSIGPIEPVPDDFPEMNVGQAVAKIGGSRILREQKGIPAGVPYGEVRRNPEVGIPVYRNALKLAASMPQEAYDNLAALFELLNERNYSFDPSKADNLLIDKENKKFNVVDLQMLNNESMPNNGFSYMVITLMDNAYAGNVLKEKQRAIPLTDLRKTILLKSFEACKKANLPIPSLNDSSLEYSFKLAGMDGQWPAFRQHLIPGSGNQTG